MTTAQFPASAATPLIEGYCEDLAELAAALLGTLREVSNRGIEIDSCRPALEQADAAVCELGKAVRAVLGGKQIEEQSEVQLAEPAPRPTPPRPLSAPSAESESRKIKGSNRTMPLQSVCQFLGRMHKNGILHVEILGEQVTFEFVDGYVQHTTSSGCPTNERVGEILIALGFCTREELIPSLCQAAEEDLPLGDVVIGNETISHGQLLEALERQVHLRFARACRTVVASYEFEEGECQATDGRIRIAQGELAWALRQAAAK